MYALSGSSLSISPSHFQWEHSAFDQLTFRRLIHFDWVLDAVCVFVFSDRITPFLRVQNLIKSILNSTWSDYFCVRSFSTFLVWRTDNIQQDVHSFESRGTLSTRHTHSDGWLYLIVLAELLTLLCFAFILLFGSVFVFVFVFIYFHMINEIEVVTPVATTTTVSMILAVHTMWAKNNIKTR